ncbi:MAG: acyl-CoA dehydrogenase family protein [Thaumarchaeota archaeon]|nr:acyl-CoA dehydrogenase family protein [Nitrososphaerota archaeon]
MEFRLTQDQELLQETIRDFAKDEISPQASKIDLDAGIPGDLLSKLPSLGLFGITTPSEYGGAGADFLSLLLVIEELSKVSGSLGARISFHNAVVCEAILNSPNDALKSALLPKLASGTMGAFSIDPTSTVSCKIEGEDFVLDGHSEYVLSADTAGVFLILAKMRDAGKTFFCFSKERESSGFQIDAPKKLLGMRAGGTAKISFNSFRLPKDAKVFDGEGNSIALNHILATSRLAVAGQALGIGQAALDAELKYANERSQFNSKIGKFYAVKDFISMDQISLQTSRLLTYKTAAEIGTLQTLDRDSCVAKVSASSAAVQTARHSIRVHGGYGFIRDYPVERYLRDARVTQSYLESNESLKAKIAESLLGN